MCGRQRRCGIGSSQGSGRLSTSVGGGEAECWPSSSSGRPGKSCRQRCGDRPTATRRWSRSRWSLVGVNQERESQPRILTDRGWLSSCLRVLYDRCGSPRWGPQIAPRYPRRDTAEGAEHQARPWAVLDRSRLLSPTLQLLRQPHRQARGGEVRLPRLHLRGFWRIRDFVVVLSQQRPLALAQTVVR